MTDAVTIADLTANHLEGAVALSTSVGWAHRYEDWLLAHSLSKGRVALLHGRVIGTALRTDFEPDLSCLNMIIVARDMRSRGLGHTLIVSAMQTDEPRKFRLVATTEGVPLYHKLGFKQVRHILKMEGQLDRVPIIEGASDGKDRDREDIIALDRMAFGASRSGLIHWLFDNARVAVFRGQEGIIGFAALRRFGDGHVLGPVVARDVSMATALMSRLACRLQCGFLRVDITEGCGLEPWLKGIGLSRVQRSPVMQCGNQPASSRYMALFSQAFG